MLAGAALAGCRRESDRRPDSAVESEHVRTFSPANPCAGMIKTCADYLGCLSYCDRHPKETRCKTLCLQEKEQAKRVRCWKEPSDHCIGMPDAAAR